jgi:hypothetical protein
MTINNALSLKKHLINKCGTNKIDKKEANFGMLRPNNMQSHLAGRSFCASRELLPYFRGRNIGMDY